MDGARNDAGSVGGWCLTITTADGPFAASATSVVSSPNPSLPGDAVMFTATVTGGGNPATSGTVTFREGSTTLAADLPVNALGQASFATDALSVGAHAITAHFSGNLEVLISTGSVTHNVTVLPPGRWCSDDPIAVPDVGAATPYPSTIIVSGAGIDTTQVTVHLLNVSHSFPRDLDVLLVGPTGEDLVLMSDVDLDRTTDATLTFSDVASGPIPLTNAWQRALTSRPTLHSEIRRCLAGTGAGDAVGGHQAGHVRRRRPERHLESVRHRRPR